MINRLKRPTFWLQTLLLTCIVGFASLVQAQLKVGDAAPSFQALGALAGQAVEFNLNEVRKIIKES